MATPRCSNFLLTGRSTIFRTTPTTAISATGCRFPRRNEDRLELREAARQCRMPDRDPQCAKFPGDVELTVEDLHRPTGTGPSRSDRQRAGDGALHGYSGSMVRRRATPSAPTSAVVPDSSHPRTGSSNPVPSRRESCHANFRFLSGGVLSGIASSGNRLSAEDPPVIGRNEC